ncbi:MAG: endonuclease/exonuclease/phosphatase family protein [Anaerolineales bacterium]
MTLLDNKYIKVNYPNPNTLNIYQKIKVMGEKFTRNRKFKQFTRRLISVSKPAGQISIVGSPQSIRAVPNKDEVTILSANLCHDWPRKRGLISRLECFVELVEEQEADILLLQEIARTDEFYADEWLGEKLGMAYVYSRANGNVKNINFEEGLGVFSRFPIEKPRLAQLSDYINPFHRRIALGASIHTNLGEVVAYSVHLAISKRKNQTQLSYLKRWVENESRNVPAIIGGDFNAGEHTSQIQSAQNEWWDSYREINRSGNGYTHQINWPWGEKMHHSRLDYIFFRRGQNNWHILDAKHIDLDGCSISDHKPVLVKAKIIENKVFPAMRNYDSKFQLYD